MRDDGYNYIEDGDLPETSKPLWIDSKGGSGIGFYKDGKWFWNKRIVGEIFLPIKGEVVCWRYLENK